MKLLIIVAAFAIPILIGYAIKLAVRKKPKVQLLIWGIIMLYMLSGLIGSLVLVINQKTPLFTKHHMANEVFVIVTAGFLVSGAYYFLRNKKYLLNRNTDSESTVNRHGR